AYGQAQAQADVACGEKRFRSLLDSFGSESGAIIPNFDQHARTAVALRVWPHADNDFGVSGVGLQRVEYHFGEGVFEGGAISLDDDRLLFMLVLEPSRFDGLMSLRFLERFLQEWG